MPVTGNLEYKGLPVIVIMSKRPKKSHGSRLTSGLTRPLIWASMTLENLGQKTTSV